MNLHDVNLFKDITKDDLESLLVCCNAKKKKYDKGQFVWHSGDIASKVGIVLSGKVNIIKEDVLGNRNIIGMVSAGHIFGETFACANIDEYPVSVEIAMGGEIMLLSLANVIRQCPSACSYHTQLIRNLVEIMAQKNFNLNRKISYLNKKTTKQKIATLLIGNMRNEADKSITLDFSREEMADYLGINRSALSRELSLLKEEGIIDYKKNKFTIDDIDALGDIIS